MIYHVSYCPNDTLFTVQNRFAFRIQWSLYIPFCGKNVSKAYSLWRHSTFLLLAAVLTEGNWRLFHGSDSWKDRSFLHDILRTIAVSFLFFKLVSEGGAGIFLGISSQNCSLPSCVLVSVEPVMSLLSFPLPSRRCGSVCESCEIAVKKTFSLNCNFLSFCVSALVCVTRWCQWCHCAWFSLYLVRALPVCIMSWFFKS